MAERLLNLSEWASRLLALLERKYPDAQPDYSEFRRYDLPRTDRQVVVGIAKARLSELPRLHVYAGMQYGEARGILLALGLLTGHDIDEVEMPRARPRSLRPG